MVKCSGTPNLGTIAVALRDGGQSGTEPKLCRPLEGLPATRPDARRAGPGAIFT